VLVHNRAVDPATFPGPFPGPIVAAIGDRLLERIDAIADDLTTVIRRAEPFYDTESVVSIGDLRASIGDNLAYILGRMAGRGSPGLEAPRATGRRRAEQGAPLPAILHSYRVAGTYLWATILQEGRAHGDDATDLLPAASELWSIIDELSGAVTDAYRETVAERTRANAQTRNAMLDALLRGDLGDGSRLWDSAAILKLPHRGDFSVVAATVPSPGVESIPRAEEALRAKGISSAWRVEIDAHIGVVALTARHGIDQLCSLLAGMTSGPAGVSEPYGSLEQTPAALRQARLAHATATGGVIRFGAAPIAVLLASAPDPAANVAQAILGPVLALPEAESAVLLSTLRAWFAEDGATAQAAAKLHVHRNTVRYRLRRIEELTGRDLTRPSGIAELHLALEAARILRLQAG
jgi:PucR C-terminal helix-turn-helix domain/GGDEF-like domain